MICLLNFEYIFAPFQWSIPPFRFKCQSALFRCCIYSISIVLSVPYRKSCLVYLFCFDRLSVPFRCYGKSFSMGFLFHCDKWSVCFNYRVNLDDFGDVFRWSSRSKSILYIAMIYKVHFDGLSSPFRYELSAPFWLTVYLLHFDSLYVPIQISIHVHSYV
jgi:hypothetical protein